MTGVLGCRPIFLVSPPHNNQIERLVGDLAMAVERGDVSRTRYSRVASRLWQIGC
jgi:hypothetical protein